MCGVQPAALYQNLSFELGVPSELSAIIMIPYLLLGAAGFLSLLGLGLLSMLALLLTWFVAQSEARNSTGAKSEYAQKVAGTAFKAGVAHVIITVLLTVKVVITLQSGEGLIEAFLAHWLIDHAAEFTIGVWLSFRAISDHLKLGDEQDEAPGQSLANNETAKEGL